MPGRHRSARGLTVIELILVIAILAVLGAIALPRIEDYRERARVTQAKIDIRAINVKLRHYMVDNKLPPDSLAAVGEAGRRDPWGRPYVYLRLAGASKSVIGQARKNKNLVPINSDFDLYSVGKDGMTAVPLVAKASRDDVVLADDGRFVGLATEYE